MCRCLGLCHFHMKALVTELGEMGLCLKMIGGMSCAKKKTVFSASRGSRISGLIGYAVL